MLVVFSMQLHNNDANMISKKLYDFLLKLLTKIVNLAIC